MDAQKRLLELRKMAKSMKPRFVVRESNFGGRVKKRWRYPQGKHSAVRMEFKGRPALVTIGYGSPKAVRGLHSSGLERAVVNNAKQLLALDASIHGAIIASGVGNKKKQELCVLAAEKKIRVLNIRDPAAAAKNIAARFQARQKQRHSKNEQKTKKNQEKEKKAEEKKKEQHIHSPEKKDDENQKDEQKEMAEKTIIKKQ